MAKGRLFGKQSRPGSIRPKRADEPESDFKALLFGVLAYPAALLPYLAYASFTWWFQADDTVAALLLPCAPWAICVLLMNHYRIYKLRFYWWVIPSFFICTWPLLRMGWRVIKPVVRTIF